MATRTAAVTPRRSPSSKSTPPRHSPSSLPARPAAGLRLAFARTGDHVAIHGLLTSIFHGPSPAEFHAQLDEPGYQASDRIVVRDGDQIAAHLRVARQTIQVGTQTLPAGRIMDLATAEEYRGRGLATAMLAAGERAAADRGALVALTRTRVPRLFARRGWSICGKHSFSTAAPRAVLAELSFRSAARNGDQVSIEPWPRQRQPIVVRPLRRIELPAVVRLYENDLSGRFGRPLRSHDYWEWLLARGACDRAYVAATEPETSDLNRLLDTIVGYAFMRQSRIVELITAPGQDEVARHLLARACADASEQGSWLVQCDLPPGHPLHAMLHAAGGEVTCSREHAGEVFMAKLLDPLAVLRRMAGEFAARARLANLSRPYELGVDVSMGPRQGSKLGGLTDRYRFALSVGRRALQVETGGPSRNSIAVGAVDLAPLVLGGVTADELCQAGRLKAGPKANVVARALFPTAGWWRPPLDDLLA